MSEILCSIIIPYYNVPCELVNKCLTSILNQNWDGNNYEVIFVNDGSPLPVDDSTKEILSKFKKRFLIEQENGGLSSARNTGINIASGDYIFFVDPDDYWFGNKLGDLLPHLKRKEHDIIKFQSVHMPIEVAIDEKTKHLLYYDDSLLLKKLAYYPYVQKQATNKMTRS